MTILTGNLATLILSVSAWAFVLCWTYKTGWLIRTKYKYPILGYVHSIVSGGLAGLWIWIIYFIHFKLH